MATLSDRAVAELAEATRRLNSRSAPAHLPSLLASLSQLDGNPFSQEQIDASIAAADVMCSPPEKRPAWPTAQGSRGLFFVFEGLDRSGKTTQSKLLAKHLESSGSVKWMCFPNRQTPSGMLIDLYLRRMIELPDETVHLLFSTNRWEASQMIVEEMNRGVHLVCDRYAFSGVAYSVAKGLDFSWCQEPDVGLPTPDSVFYIHVTPAVGAGRVNFGDERYENAEMQTRVREEFRRTELKEGVTWHDVDGAREIDVIHKEVKAAVHTIRVCDIENGPRPIKRLWI